MNALLPDLDSREHVESFVDAFYAKVLSDPRLAPIFLDVASIELDVHLPHIKNYWCKLLLGDSTYRRHTMNKHRALHQKRPLYAEDFEQWLQLFYAAVDAGYAGPKAARAKQVASSIASNMQEGM